jgi:hypothetical protein
MSDTQPNETNSDWTKEVSDNLMKLAFMAADHGIDSVRASSGPLIPFMIIEGEKRELRRYVTENVEDGLVKAREAASSLNSNTKAYAIAHDGYITLQDGIYDAIIIVFYLPNDIYLKRDCSVVLKPSAIRCWREKPNSD